MFNAPKQGEKFTAAEAEGHLLIVKPTEYRTEIPTANGVKDAVAIDVVDLDVIDPATGGPKVARGALWFGGMLVGGLKTQIGQLVLARMGKGTAKPGQSAPWVLNDASSDPAAVAQATAWMSAHPEFQGAASPAATAEPTATGAVQGGYNPATGEVSPEVAALLQQLQQ